jgi:hypothetical protein
MPVYLGFNTREDLIPEVHFFSKERFGRASPPEAVGFVRFHHARPPGTPIPSRFCGFALSATRKKRASDRDVPRIRGVFPQFFPQVWKTLGRDQMRMGSPSVLV